MENYILALDQGTTSSRAILFSQTGEIAAMSQVAIPQYYPKPGWVEHDPDALFQSILQAAADVLQKAAIAPGQVAGIGVTNQRETVVVWDKATGIPVSNAIVWQCRRTAGACQTLIRDGLSAYIQSTTGLLPDAYFSGTKLQWILENVPGARQMAQAGKLLCGTVDSWLIWNLTGRRVHVSDYSNCSRTMLFDIRRLCWDERLCQALSIPMSMLPQPVPSAQVYGCLASGLPGLEALSGVPICGCAGDQPAALFGQGCFHAGQVKNTYGTGCFMLMNTGDTPVFSHSGLLTSVGWSLNGKLSYALEGSVFNAGSSIQWLRDELGLIGTARECDILAESVPDSGGVYLVSAFTGLGAPYWDMYARGTIVGLTRGSSRAHIARAVLEGIAFQTADLMAAMRETAGIPITELRADGGASVSNIMLQFQADLLRLAVNRPQMVETTAAGAAYLAGLACGMWADLSQLEGLRKTARVFLPQAEAGKMEARFSRWHKAVQRALDWAQEEETI